MRKVYFVVFCLFALTLNGQKKLMDHTVYSLWNTITNIEISNDGKWIKYHLSPGKGDQTLVLRQIENNAEYRFKRVKSSDLSFDNKVLAYTVQPSLDTITALRRSKVKKEEFPKDSLIILHLEDMRRDTFPAVNQYKLPEKWGSDVAFEALLTPALVDSTSKKTEKPKPFFFRYNADIRRLDTFEKVDAFLFAEKEDVLVFSRSGKDSTGTYGVFLIRGEQENTDTLHSGFGKYDKLTISNDGKQIAFLWDDDLSDRRIRNYHLLHWKEGAEIKYITPDNGISSGKDWKISANGTVRFSEKGNRLFYGIAPDPVLPDSLALEEEMVSVEVWTTEDPMLYTMQEVQERRLKNKTFQVMYDLDSEKSILLENESYETSMVASKGDGRFAIIADNSPFMKEVTWQGNSKSNIYLVNLETGEKWLVAQGVEDNPIFSPTGKYLTWFDTESEEWIIYDAELKIRRTVTTEIPSSMVDELHDSPSNPRPYGMAGWMDSDAYLMVYDRYDVWKIDPDGREKPVQLTNLRTEETSVRLIRLDSDKENLEEEMLVYLFNERDKTSGYGKLHLGNGQLDIIENGPYSYSRRPIISRQSEKLLFTKENFQTFPDLILADRQLQNQQVITKANPHQSEYSWGNIELFEWTDFKGEKVQGLLVKPEGFDPSKKYPLIVNFYERSSDGLYSHRAPEPHRSTINYTYYANKGYLIFNPDVRYDIGYPGESCYNAVVSGVEALLKEGFVDQQRIGVQGHSWGGYQIAYLLNKTDIFRCAEAGAPVVNMVSAYGGIRWASGMSRMFQYEKTQSRLGVTLWENPDLYLTNSPIFELDRMNTPVLILHNDNDGAVPWYQGIEYFMALRRLGKPAWFLNYNGEPHWPLKWENRVDFNRRMEQFFAHFLLDAPMPVWMIEGVPAIEKGIKQRFELKE